jgi:hypothetical protein
MSMSFVGYCKHGNELSRSTDIVNCYCCITVIPIYVSKAKNNNVDRQEVATSTMRKLSKKIHDDLSRAKPQWVVEILIFKNNY